TPLPLPESTLLAAQLVSAIAGVLLVVPTYLLGRMLFGRNVGFAAALLFQVLPVPARITSDGLAEGLYLLGSATALVIGVRPAVVGILEETGKGLHYGTAGLALLGVFALRRRFAADPGLGVLLAIVGVNVV